MGWFNSGAKAGKKQDKRWDKQVMVQYRSAKDQRRYASQQQELNYNNAVLAKEIQQRNLEQQLLWQEQTAMNAWDAEVKQREFEFNSQMAAYNKSERLYGAQIGLNARAREMADTSATAVAEERLDAVMFQGREALLNLDKTQANISQQRRALNLKRSQQRIDTVQQRLGLDLKIGQQRTDINLQKIGATLEQQQKRAEAAFTSEKQLVELMQAAGQAEAKGQTGRTAQKNIQAIMAAGGRAQAQLADQITRGDSAYNLTMMGLDASLIYGEAEHGLAQTALTTKAAYEDLAYNLDQSVLDEQRMYAGAEFALGKEQRDATKLSIRAAHKRSLEKNEFDEYGANLAADAKRMSMPGMAPLPPKPLELPRAVLMDPMLPQKLPKVRKGAGSGGVGAAQGAAQDTGQIINMFTQLAGAALGGWISNM